MLPLSLLFMVVAVMAALLGLAEGGVTPMKWSGTFSVISLVLFLFSLVSHVVRRHKQSPGK
jgi:uncharacterized membrane protein YtjA (UPF0391 family)